MPCLLPEGLTHSSLPVLPTPSGSELPKCPTLLQLASFVLREGCLLLCPVPPPQPVSVPSSSKVDMETDLPCSPAFAIHDELLQEQVNKP